MIFWSAFSKTFTFIPGLGVTSALPSSFSRSSLQYRYLILFLLHPPRFPFQTFPFCNLFPYFKALIYPFTAFKTPPSQLPVPNLVFPSLYSYTLYRRPRFYSTATTDIDIFSLQLSQFQLFFLSICTISVLSLKFLSAHTFYATSKGLLQNLHLLPHRLMFL